jgi:phosphonatase-like hydrolase
MNEIELIVFDVAGTTVEDRGQVPAAFKAAFVEHGLVITSDELSKVRGSSKREAVFNLLPEGDHRVRQAEAVYASFCEQLERRIAEDGVHPIDGAEDVFDWLKGRGIRLALNTGFDRNITNILISALQWKDVVNAVVCGEDVRLGRPAPYLIFHAMEATGTTSVHKVVNIGDTAVDLRAGHNAGVRFNVGVLSGAHNREQLEREPHTHLLNSLADLPEVISMS